MEPRTHRSRDRGLTLVELLVVTALLGLVITVVATAMVTVVRVSPTTHYRIDDARSVRALQTWLVRDAASTPPEQMTSAADLGTGGYIFSDGSTAWLPVDERCGAGTGNILHMAWNDDGQRFHANYRIDNDRVIRTYCSSSGGEVMVRIAGDVSTSFCSSPGFSAAYSYGNAGASVPVESVEICVRSVARDSGLSQGDGATSDIVISVTSRNLVDS
jgi:prepilin-type N-terminal cleavage/methylation domain-containing protein